MTVPQLRRRGVAQEGRRRDRTPRSHLLGAETISQQQSHKILLIN